jgi:predicted transcriptional regulator
MLDRTRARALDRAANGRLDGAPPPPELQPLIDHGFVAADGDRYTLTARGRRLRELGRVHRLMARGVERGIPDGSPPAPALRDLLALGLAEATGERYALTPAGRELLHPAP